MTDARQSELLLARIREGLKRRGWNTAVLASKIGVERPRLRQILAGRVPLTVDAFSAMVEAMQFTPEEMGLPAGLAAEDRGAPDDAGPEIATPLQPEGAALWAPDPDGIQAEQCLRLGFACGIDMLFHARTADLRTSGVPRAVLDRFPQRVPIRLEAAYHPYNRARYLPEGVELRLSFDGVYTCVFPWSAIEQVVFLPEPPVAPAEPAEPPRLRLVT
ncbi:MAG: helix-turn-helix transcriptional regulator [Deltaproteobacteria bacterium]|nr:helix-turn-helix transcriptional regulator [Deltaproteobacteria bacterium]